MEVAASMGDDAPHRGVLVHGPAGVGKTSLVLAAAHQTNTPLVHVRCRDIDAGSDIRWALVACSWCP